MGPLRIWPPFALMRATVRSLLPVAGPDQGRHRRRFVERRADRQGGSHQSTARKAKEDGAKHHRFGGGTRMTGLTVYGPQRETTGHRADEHSVENVTLADAGVPDAEHLSRRDGS